jgi:hypothetical protein
MMASAQVIQSKGLVWSRDPSLRMIPMAQMMTAQPQRFMRTMPNHPPRKWPGSNIGINMIPTRAQRIAIRQRIRDLMSDFPSLFGCHGTLFSSPLEAPQAYTFFTVQPIEPALCPR